MSEAVNNAPFKEIENLMRSGNFSEALEQLINRIKESPNDVESLYLLAVTHRYLNQYEMALEVLHKIKLLAPDHSRAIQEQGHVLNAIDQPERALEAFARAVQINPALLASWRAQIQILQQQGRGPQAQAVAQRYQDIAKLPAPLRQVMELVAQGKLVKAESLCRKFLQKNPTNVAGMQQLAAIGSKLGILEDAEFLLESAIDLQPHNNYIRMDYLQILRKRQKFEKAHVASKALLDSQPDNPQFKSLYAIECMQMGDYNTAIKVFNEVLEQLPGEPATLTSLGHAYKTFGNQDAAIDSYRAALKFRPQHCEAWYSMANLKTVEFSNIDISEMLALKDDLMLTGADHVYLNFALGKAYEDRKQFDDSFQYYALGNKIKKSQSKYDAQKMSQELQTQMDVCDVDFAQSTKSNGNPAPDPIFIVGLPRAGSTLLEQILSSHSMVDGTMELPNILSLAHELRVGDKLSHQNHYPQNLVTLSKEQRHAYGERYIESTRVHRKNAPFFIDKMPNNFRHIGLIKAILPNAKIIDARRQPMACCFSGFKQLFAEGQEFSYDLDDIGRYYQDYVALMAHWDSIFPKQILRMQYEDVVNDLDNQVKRLLDYCNLPFEEACLNFHSNKRAVRTASSEQVRKPIYKSGLEQWKNYEHCLQPLKQSLSNIDRDESISSEINR